MQNAYMQPNMGMGNNQMNGGFGMQQMNFN